MRRPVCYDVTRLLTRVLNATPNGIDRVDYALAQHFLAGDPATTFGSTATGFGARIMAGPAAASAVAGIAAHWGETAHDVASDPVYRRTVAWLGGRPVEASRPMQLPQRTNPPLARVDIAGIADWLRQHGVPIRKTPARDLPPHAAYINSSQFPLWVAASFAWLETRPDVKATFFIHDLLPVLLPEYFRKAEFERHQRRLRNFARFGAAAMVTTKTVAHDLAAHMATLGRKDVPIYVAPTPIAPVFATPLEIDPDLADHPFFVLCSTIEPRKNHLMILSVWRALVGRLGADAPKLVLVGTLGWHYDPIIDLIDRSPALRPHVLQVSGLSTPGLKRLIDNAQAVLMPTFGEGYGLPVHEGLAAGAPVLASDIPVFRDIKAEGLTLLSPLDGEAWLDAIEERASGQRTRISRSALDGWDGYFAGLETFIDAL